MKFLSRDEYKIKDGSHLYEVGVAKQRPEQLRYIEEGCLVGHFNGVQTLLSYMNEHMNEPKQFKDSSDKGDFYYFETYEKAFETYTERPEEVMEFKEIEDDINVWEEVGNDIDYNVTGDFVDIGRYMHGIPEVFGSMHNGNPKRYRANITIALNWTGSTDKETINERLKHILATVDWLETNNIRTSLTGVTSNDCGHLEVAIKDYQEVLDLRELAVVSHSDFLRRISFRFREYSDTLSYGYGSSQDFSGTMRRNITDSDKDDEVGQEIELFISNGSNTDTYVSEFDRLRDEVRECVESNELKKIGVLM